MFSKSTRQLEAPGCVSSSAHGVDQFSLCLVDDVKRPEFRKYGQSPNLRTVVVPQVQRYEAYHYRDEDPVPDSLGCHPHAVASRKEKQDGDDCPI